MDERRPRLPERRLNELLDIALEEFLERGMEAASVSEIARRAQASKTTIYVRFKSKEQLFLAVLDRHIDHVFAELSVELPVDAPIRKTLREYGNRLAHHLSSKEHKALFRIIVMDAPRFPELGRRYEELRAKRSRDTLARYMEAQIKRGRLEAKSPELLARHFVNFLFGSLRWIIYGLDPNDAKELSRHVDDTVEVFLHAYQPR